MLHSSLPSLNPNHGDYDITWLNVVENDEAQKVIDVCIECWQSAGPEACKKNVHHVCHLWNFFGCVLP